MTFGDRNYQTVSGSSMENAARMAAISMEMNNCICSWGRDRKMDRFATAGEAESVTAHEVINIIGTGCVLRTAVIFFYISNEGVSLLENAGHLGLPIPEKLKEILEQLHERSGEGSE